MRKRCCAMVVLILIFCTLPSFAEEKFYEISAKKFEYTPHIIRVNKGDEVSLRLISEDVQHGFFLDGYAQEMSAYPGQEGNLRFIADKAGRFSFRCSVTCGGFHPYMVGFFIVEPNRRFHFYVIVILLLALVSFLVHMLGGGKVTADGQQG